MLSNVVCVPVVGFPPRLKSRVSALNINEAIPLFGPTPAVVTLASVSRDIIGRIFDLPLGFVVAFHSPTTGKPFFFVFVPFGLVDSVSAVIRV